MQTHARHSRAEPGCRTFEVLQDAEDAAVIVLYEVYDSGEAYAAHRETPHYARFRAWAPPLVEPGAQGLFQQRRVLRRRGDEDEPAMGAKRG